MPYFEKRPATHGPRKIRLNDLVLFEKITSVAQLNAAWSKVWTNAGASGGDNVSVHRFAQDVVRRLSSLRHSLLDGLYQPGPLRTVAIPKNTGKGVRNLSIPCVVDRIVQTSAAISLTPLFDEEFEPVSFGYRPGRSVNQAVARISFARSEGFDFVVDADIENFFERIPHDRLMERWYQSVDEGPLSELIWAWLTHAQPDGRGVPQGSPISPLLANLYLDRIDEEFHSRDMRLVRFADDFVILCRTRTGAQEAMDRVVSVLKEFGLVLNRQKSQIVDFEQGFKFLGHLFVRSMAMKVSPKKSDEIDFEQALKKIAKADAAAAADADLVLAEEARNELAGYSPGLRNLHIRAKDRRLNIRNQAFSIEEKRTVFGQAKGASPTEGGSPTEKWHELMAIPHQRVDRIDLGPGVVATDAALRHVIGTDTSLAFVNGHGETLGWVSDTLSPRASRHLDQARMYIEPDKRLELAQKFVEARLRNQRAVLRRLLSGREVAPAGLLEILKQLNIIIGRGEKSRIRHAKTVNQLMGFEGAATAQWWKGISMLAHPDFKFSKRDRDRSADPANICLNFLSWLLNRDISVAVMRAGLHPGFGVLHSVSNQRDACVYDLMEEFRAHFIGGLLVYASNRRLVRGEMFSSSNGKTRMRSHGGNALVRAYESRANGKVKSPGTGKRITWRRLMVEQSLALAAHVEGSTPYSPYIMDY